MAARLNMDGCPDSMAVADLGKDPSLKTWELSSNEVMRHFGMLSSN